MVTRVQLDESHVSRCVTVRREKVLRYIRNSNELRKVRAFRTLLYACENLSTLRENIARFLKFLAFLLIFWWFRHWLERWSAIGRSGATLSFAGSWGESRCEGRKLVWYRVDPEEDTFDVTRLLHSSQPTGSVIMRLGFQKKYWFFK